MQLAIGEVDAGTDCGDEVRIGGADGEVVESVSISWPESQSPSRSATLLARHANTMHRRRRPVVSKFLPLFVECRQNMRHWGHRQADVGSMTPWAHPYRQFGGVPLTRSWYMHYWKACGVPPKPKSRGVDYFDGRIEPA